MLPDDLPPWGTVHFYYRHRRLDGTWHKVLDVLRTRLRRAGGRKKSPSAAIVDSQSVRTGSGGERGCDAGKRTPGHKRHIVVDTTGLLLSVVVHSASVQDRDGVKLLGGRIKGRFPRLRSIWPDAAYEAAVGWARAFARWHLDLVRKPGDRKGFVVLPSRWVVEQAFAWLMNSRRLARDHEPHSASSEAMFKLMLKIVKPVYTASHAVSEPASDHPRRRRLPQLAVGLRRLAVPRGDALRAGAARKKSNRLIVEADEMWSSSGRKRESCWIWVGLESGTRQVVAMVAGDRSDQTARCFRDALSDGYRSGAVVYSDLWAAYAAAIPEAQHVLCGKGDEMTCHVERSWCTVRRRCARFVRKTLSFSRCDLNHTGSLWLLIRHYHAYPREGHYPRGRSIAQSPRRSARVRRRLKAGGDLSAM